MVNIIKAEGKNEIEYIKEIRRRAETVQDDAETKVSKIINDIKRYGDAALEKYTRQFDCSEFNIQEVKVTKEEIEAAYSLVDEEFIEALKDAKKNIWDFHKRQLQNSWMANKDGGILMGQTIRGLQSVGIYVPGGKASYPSSVLMNTIPAKVSGVEKIVMATPPKKDGSINPCILVAADIAGIDEICKIGGAQAVAALAFGTESVDKVDKIVGPGNIYVATAKKMVFGNVGIDMIAGPSEILIVADDSGRAKFIAADMMSQAEHDTLASSILVTTSKKLAVEVLEELDRQIQYMERKDIIKSSLENFGAIFVVDGIERAVSIANDIAPEHLELMVRNPFEALPMVKNAGSIFLGEYSPEPLGDYFAGPNHVLPTGGTARFFSPLSVDDFIKKSSFIYYPEGELKKCKDKIMKLAEVEGLYAHKNSIKVRFE